MQFAAERGALFFLILNNDTLVAPDFLKPMVNAALQDDRVGLVGALICYADEPEKVWFGGGIFNRFLEGQSKSYNQVISSATLDRVTETEWVTGCTMLIPLRTYKLIGGFYEPFFIWSEDYDYSLKARKAGFKLVVARDSRIYHKVGRSLGVLKPLSYYYGTWNRLLLKRLHLPAGRRTLFLVFFLLSRIPRYAQLALSGRWDLVKAGCAAIFDYFLGRTGKWLAHEG